MHKNKNISQEHISRFRKRQSLQGRSTSAPSVRRHKSKAFDFKFNCIICGDVCLLSDTNNPTRQREITKCSIADRSGQKTVKERLLDICDIRADAKGEKVRLRLSGAASDLHAADGQYRRDCYQDFINPKYVASVAVKALVNSEVEKEDINFAMQLMK